MAKVVEPAPGERITLIRWPYTDQDINDMLGIPRAPLADQD